jgi:hypothetical protein
MECTPNKTYICELCTKTYSSRQNLWKHNNKFHKSEVKENAPKDTKLTLKDTKNTIEPNNHALKDTKNTIEPNNHALKDTKKCKYCEKSFTRTTSLKRHLLICKEKETTNIKLKEENELLKQQLEKQEQERIKYEEEQDKKIEELKKMVLEIMNVKAKTHHKTIKKINNQLNTGNINSNNTINNYNIITLGNENLPELLSRNEKLDILNQRYMALEHMVTYKHFNEKFPQFKNIMITNTQNNIAYKYDKVSNNFIATDKNDLVTDVVNGCMEDIETLYDELEPDLLKKTKEIIEKVIYKMKHDSEYKETKKKDVKLVIYNNKDKVTKEIVHTIEIDM